MNTFEFYTRLWNKMRDEFISMSDEQVVAEINKFMGRVNVKTHSVVLLNSEGAVDITRFSWNSNGVCHAYGRCVSRPELANLVVQGMDHTWKFNV